MKAIVVARSFIVRKRKVLLIKRAPYDIHNPGLWECPGGKLDDGEDLFSGRQREIRQETGLLVESLSPVMCVASYVIRDGRHTGMTYICTFDVAKFMKGKIELSDEHDDYAWVSYRKMFSYNLTEEAKKAAEVLSEYLF